VGKLSRAVSNFTASSLFAYVVHNAFFHYHPLHLSADVLLYITLLQGLATHLGFICLRRLKFKGRKLLALKTSETNTIIIRENFMLEFMVIMIGP
jgi:hypothetical protein